MAHAYTPGLKVSHSTVITKKRLLPIPGEVVVNVGDKVSATTCVAKTGIPGKVHTLNIINKLSITPDEIKNYMTVKVGDNVEKDQPIAENKPLIRWFKTQVKSPVKGIVESISEITGQVLIREPIEILKLLAYIDGVVKENLPKAGVIVETKCSYVQGIFGVGGEEYGELKVVVDTPSSPLTPQNLDFAHKDKIIIGGSYATYDVFHKAKEIGIKGIVVGGIDDSDLRKLLGYDLGVAITGTEKLGFTLIVTEGFGRINMAQKTFDLLKMCQGKKASISGATQIRAGVIRPEIIIAHTDESTEKVEKDFISGTGMKIGNPVRIIRQPYFGAIGKVKSLPPDLTKIDTESRVRIVEVELSDDKTIFIPRANVELIED